MVPPLRGTFFSKPVTQPPNRISRPGMSVDGYLTRTLAPTSMGHPLRSFTDISHLHRNGSISLCYVKTPPSRVFVLRQDPLCCFPLDVTVERVMFHASFEVVYGNETQATEEL